MLNRAISAFNSGRLIEAEELCERLVAAKHNDLDALHLLAVVQSRLGKRDKALVSYDRALKVRPDYVEALFNRGVTLHELERFEEALASYDSALKLRPDFAEALSNRGNALKELKRFDEALASYDRALKVRPAYLAALFNRANTLKELKRFDEALASYDRALKLRPDFAEALSNRGNILQELKLFDAALASYDSALKVRPNFAEALSNRGNTLQELKRFDEALASYENAITLQPDHPHAFSGMAFSALNLCDWTRTAKFLGEIEAHVEEQKSIVSPFVFLAYSGDAALQLKCARTYIESKIAKAPPSLSNGMVKHRDKIRVAYLSADFRRHSLAYLTAELFEAHDRRRFEILGISFGPDDGSDMRLRLINSFDQFLDVKLKSDHDAARRLNDLDVDIAVDLTGYTANSRPGILTHRPAPIQVSYMGYPGTMGAKFIDYVIADGTVLPLDQQPFWTEKIVHLPDSYWVTDSKTGISPRVFMHREVGLPDEGFVFCCFNNSYKITARVFDVWMRLLRAINGSVLWLLRDNNGAETNLCKEAAARGIDPARLVFGNRMPLEDHLARHRLADLFLDTLPCNAHTTASDALWAGLPLLTCCGESFAGRVAASLLNAIGLPELVTSNLEEYEALALELARNAPLLSGIKDKLARHRDTYPLFKSKRFTGHLEAAYTTMREICQRGESPRSFSVAPTADAEDDANTS